MAFKARSRLASFGYALRGLAHVARTEANMRIHLACAGLITGAGLWRGIGSEDWRWIGLAMTLVIAAECLNTAVERACDVAEPEHNPLVKQAKDAAAGAVLLTALFAAGIGAAVFLK